MPASEETLLLSPDPLALSNENIPTPSSTKPRGPVVTPRKPLVNASGNTRVQDFYISTPPSRRKSKSPAKSSKENASTSPWRIRLTLQAEQVDDQISRIQRGSPSRQPFIERMTTITVPLKGGDDSPPAVVKRGRGRPKKSSEGIGNRNNTPKPGAKGRRRSMLETSDEHGDSASLAKISPPKKNRGRPRKSLEPKTDSLSSAITKGPSHTAVGDSVKSRVIVDEPTRPKSRGRRQEITPMKFTINSDAATNQGSSMNRDGGSIDSTQAFDNSANDGLVRPDLPYPPSQQLSQTTKECALTQQPPELIVDDGQDILPSEALLEDTFSRADVDEPHGQADVDPTNEHQEYDTILESEGFSMVSVSSLASTDNQSNKSPSFGSSWDNQKHTPAVAPSLSAPPAFRDDGLPSSSRHLDKHQDGTPKLARVVRAGIALQGVLSQKNRANRLNSPFQESRNGKPSSEAGIESSPDTGSFLPSQPRSPKERLDNLFSGFGAGTRRELRAGLRLGEELAKRQRKIPKKPTRCFEINEDIFDRVSSPKYAQLHHSAAQPSYNLKVPSAKGDGQKEVRYPSLSRNQLPTPERSDSEADEDRMSCKESTPIKLEQTDTPANSTGSNDQRISHENSSVIDHTMMAREAEWQREREAVSRQIEMANKSQVIVIDSDSDDDEDKHDENDESFVEHSRFEEDADGGGDIWQAEAHSADSSRNLVHEQSNISPQADVVKPRRSKLPNSWRCNSEVVYTNEIEPSDADLFWQPENAQRSANVLKERDGRAPKVDVHLTHTEEKSSRVLHEGLDEEAEEPDESTGALIASQLNTVRAKDNFSRATATNPSLARSSSETRSPPAPDRKGAYQGQAVGKTIHMPPEDKAKENRAETLEIDKQAKPKNPESAEDSHLEDLKDETLHIDPFLLQPQPQSPATAIQKEKPKPVPQPPLTLNTPDEPPSFLSFLVSPLTTLLHPTPPPVPPATKSDLLLSSHPEPLSLLTPWTPAHFRALAPLYYSALLYPVGIFPFNPKSPAAKYLGARVVTSLEWERRVTRIDCAVADAFVVVLEERGYEQPSRDHRDREVENEERIDEGVVVRMCVELWVGMCMRGETMIDASRGEKSGLRRGGDRLWGRGDVRWEECASGYFERKRREFDGLPSWKERGVRWR